MMVVVLNSLLTERVEEQEKFTQTGLQCTHQQGCVVAAVTAPTAPGCVEMNAAGRFSCLCCDAVKGILGNMRWEVGESHLQSRLGKVGGSGADRVYIRGSGLYLVRCELWIGIRLGQLLMTYYKFARTKVGTSMRIENRPESQVLRLNPISYIPHS